MFANFSCKLSCDNNIASLIPTEKLLIPLKTGIQQGIYFRGNERLLIFTFLYSLILLYNTKFIIIFIIYTF